MASDSDSARVRRGALEALDDLENLDRAARHCSDQALATLLADISRNKAHQSARLMDWLTRRDALFAGRSPGAAAEVVTEPTDEPQGGAGSTVAEAADTSGRPASAGEGVAVIERREVTPDLLVFKVPRPLDFNFEAGQSVKVSANGVRRSYSIVSAPDEPFLEFFVELVPGGEMSERLRSLRVGDRLRLERPKGSFLLDRGYQQHLMVATVTGINPFVSMVRDQVRRGGRGQRLHLLHGASYSDEFGYRQELEQIAAGHPGLLVYRPTVSRPDDPRNSGWTGRTGRVDAIIDDYLQEAGLDGGSTAIYACGHQGMVDAVEQRYLAQGFQVRTESYD